MPENPSPPHSTFNQLAMLRRRWFTPLFTALFLIQLLEVVLILGLSVGLRGDITYPEGSVVYRAAAFARGEPLYLDWRQWPHQFTPYGPLTYVPVGLASRMMNPSGSMWWVYVAGRLQSLAMMLGLGYLLYDLGRRIGLSRIISLASMGALAFWTAMLSYGVSYRPDAPATFFAVLALHVVIRRKPRPVWIVAALAALYVSFWFKPIAIGILVVIALWIGRAWGLARTILILLLFAISGLVPLWLLDRYWNGTLIDNLVGFNTGAGYSFFFVKYYFGSPRLTVLIMAVGSFMAIRHLIRPANRTLRWLSIAGLGTLAFAMAQCLKIGADYNYFLLPYPLLSLIAFHGIIQLWQSDRPSHFRVREVLLWVGVIPLLAISQIGMLSGMREEFSTISKNLQPREFEKMLAAKPGMILNWVSYFSVITPRPPTLLDPYAYKIMVQHGEIDPEILLEKIRRQEFAFMVLSHEMRKDKDTLDFQEIIGTELDAAYEPARRFTGFIIYEPKTPNPYNR